MREGRGLAVGSSLRAQEALGRFWSLGSSPQLFAPTVALQQCLPRDPGTAELEPGAHALRWLALAQHPPPLRDAPTALT